MPLGLGCMRLSTSPDRAPANGIRVIHAALDAGVTLLDTADVYCFDDSEIGHNERLIAEALRSWSGDQSQIEHREADNKLLATWYLLDKSPYMVYGEVPLANGTVQRMTEVEVPLPGKK